VKRLGQYIVLQGRVTPEESRVVIVHQAERWAVLGQLHRAGNRA
jgi:hypothetical protein